MRETDALRPVRFGHRAAAYLLDRLILAAALLIPRLVVSLRDLGTAPLARAVLFRFTWTDIVCWALAAAYFTALTAASGATLGKMAMGLRVVTLSGERPSFLTALCRETFGRYLSGILCIGYLLALADPERGTLHDRICDTRVVYAPEKAAAPYTVNLLPLNPVEDPERDWYAPYRK